MGKRGGGEKRDKKVGPPPPSSSSLSIREQASGKKHSHNSNSLLKLKHLNNLALWPSSSTNNDNYTPSFASLAAFFGRRFAHFGDSLGISPHPSLFPCQRCETILQPGSNCTVRVERNRANHQRHRKTKTDVQNYVVYTCQFCSYRNLKHGTPKGYMKDLVPPKASSLKPKTINPTVEKTNLSKVKNENTNEATPPEASNACSPADSLAGSLVKSDVKLLDSKRRKRKKPELKGSAGHQLASSAPAEKKLASGTSKRKSWTTLKDIAQSEEHDRNQRFKNFSIPFVL